MQEHGRGFGDGFVEGDQGASAVVAFEHGQVVVAAGGYVAPFGDARVAAHFVVPDDAFAVCVSVPIGIGKG